MNPGPPDCSSAIQLPGWTASLSEDSDCKLKYDNTFVLIPTERQLRVHNYTNAFNNMKSIATDFKIK